jgi:eukaryotic-like serine/threonine-protein kinase
MRILIIDDSEDFRILAAQLLSIEWPDVEIDEYDPTVRGKLPDDFSIHGYDAIFLDYKLGEEDGLEWLKALKRRANCPAILFVTEHGSEEIAVKAIRLGANEYVRKRDLSKEYIGVAVREALRSHEEESDSEIGRTTLPLNANDMRPGNPLTLTAMSQRAVTDEQINDIKIGGYRIVKLIGRGGMAYVFLAERLRDQLQVVLKVLDGSLVENENFLKRFVLEYTTVAHINSPYIVRIYDQGFTDQHVFIAMEYFSMGDLKKYVRGLTIDAAFKIFYHTVKALIVIHNAGVLHRDLKPQNIMFRADGSLALVDFGIAKLVNDANPLTTRGEVFGTPYYMSPEQVSGSNADARCDIYSAGVILFEMLSGAKPFVGSSAQAIAEQHVRAPIPKLPENLSAYQGLIDRLMAKRPEARFQSAQELLAELAFTMRAMRVSEIQ